MGTFTGVICPHGSLPEISQVTVSHRQSGGWWGKRGGADWHFSPSLCLWMEGWRRERVWRERKKDGCGDLHVSW